MVPQNIRCCNIFYNQKARIVLRTAHLPKLRLKRATNLGSRLYLAESRGFFIHRHRCMEGVEKPADQMQLMSKGLHINPL